MNPASLLLCVVLSAAPNGAPVFVELDRAFELHQAGALVLDARKSPKAPFVAGAVVVDWIDYRDGLLPTGRLDSDLERLAHRLGELGLSENRSVLITGDMNEGWGEEGRIWWMLRHLGLRSVFILNGGVRSWVSAQRPTQHKATKPAKGTPMKLKPDAGLLANKHQVDRLRQDPHAVVLDVREPSEFAGATPYLEARGGHIPGARNLPWRRLLTGDGKLKPAQELELLFSELGITKERPVAAYCTGGVRSAFVVAVLHHHGYLRAANYDGSFWEWARDAALPVALPPSAR